MKSFIFESNIFKSDLQKKMVKLYQQLYPTTKPSEKITGFKQVLERLVDFLTRQFEVKVWRSLDRSGNISWHVYDPYTERTYNFASETEVRVWLDSYR